MTINRTGISENPPRSASGLATDCCVEVARVLRSQADSPEGHSLSSIAERIGRDAAVVQDWAKGINKHLPVWALIHPGFPRTLKEHFVRVLSHQLASTGFELTLDVAQKNLAECIGEWVKTNCFERPIEPTADDRHALVARLHRATGDWLKAHDRK